MTSERKTRYVLVAAEIAAAATYFVTMKWFIPHGASWSGAFLILGLLIIAALVLQSQILRTRLQKGKRNGVFDVR